MNSASLLAGMRSRASGRSVAPDILQGSTLGAAQITAVPSAAHTSLEENIERRLLSILSGAAGNRGVLTEDVLGRFRDIGDQYAPLFREILRKTARLDGGRWYKK